MKAPSSAVFVSKWMVRVVSKRIIPVISQPLGNLPIPPFVQTTHGLRGQSLKDGLNRPLKDLRISVTDRCNFRCSYCMPKEVFNSDYKYLPQGALLSFEEITLAAKSFISLGVEKLRLTGGEPLLRKNLEILIEQLAALRTVSGEPLDITLTTNGSLLARKAQSLKDAGLKRVTISLDGLDDAVFKRMNDVDFPVSDVLEGIAAAQAAGLGPIKVNMVVKRGTNEQEILPMARYFKGTGIALRFIEYMDVGATNGWRMNEVMPSAEVLKILQTELSLTPLSPAQKGETAERWGYLNEQGVHDASLGEIGFISSVTKAFCSDCNRARLTTEGQLYLCLFASQGYDLKPLIRSSQQPQTLTEAITAIWSQRTDRYSELRQQEPDVSPSEDGAAPKRRKVEMSYIGG
ncbi:MAG: Cyclic pyranopterin monophosphate synthase [Pseudomonadota bacterium]|jgi:cyclic pyranopterin phosphate synthase